MSPATLHCSGLGGEMDVNATATRIVKRIVEDIYTRGFPDEWCDLDPEEQQEIEMEWWNLIVSELDDI